MNRFVFMKSSELYVGSGYSCMGALVEGGTAPLHADLSVRL